jgi:hypothetical protein
VSALRLTLLAWLVLVPAARAQVLYTVTELLPAPYFSDSYAVQAVNNVGQTAGIGKTINPFLPPNIVIRTTPGVPSQDLGTALGYLRPRTWFF